MISYFSEKQIKQHQRKRFDDDDDFIDPRDTLAVAAAAAKPTHLTLFDALKSKLDIQGLNQNKIIT